MKKYRLHLLCSTGHSWADDHIFLHLYEALNAWENQVLKRGNMIHSKVKENGTEGCKVTEIGPRKDVELFILFHLINVYI